MVGRSGDVARRELTAADEMAIARRELAERTRAAEEYERLDRRDAAQRVRAEIAVLSRSLA